MLMIGVVFFCVYNNVHVFLLFVCLFVFNENYIPFA